MSAEKEIEYDGSNVEGIAGTYQVVEPPPVIAKLGAGATKDNTPADDSYDTANGHKVTWNSINIGMLLITGLASFAAVESCRYSKASATSAAESVTLATQSISDTRQSIRASVGVTDGRVKWTGSNAEVVLTIKNSGGTISKFTELTFEAWGCLPYPLPTGAIEVKENVPHTLQASETSFLRKSVALRPSDLALVKAGKKAIYAIGTVTYMDILDVQHTEPFALMQGGEYPWNAKSMGAMPLAP